MSAHVLIFLQFNQEEPDAPPAQLTDSPAYDNYLVYHLLEKWGWGETSSVKLQQECMQSYKDQVALLRSLNISPDWINGALEHCAGLGSSGKRINNINRDLLTYLGSPSVPPPKLVKIPILKPKHSEEQVVEVDFPIFLPHITFSHLYSSEPKLFRKQILGACPQPEDPWEI